jgi:predicted nuclease of predicted toxin-antitoxin system
MRGGSLATSESSPHSRIAEREGAARRLCLGGAREALLAAGHDVESAAGWPRDPGDPLILAHAHQNHQVLITLDKDVGEIAIVRRQSHSGIVRLVTLRAEQQGLAAVEALARYGQELSRGAIVTVEPGRVRIHLDESKQESGSD